MNGKEKRAAGGGIKGSDGHQPQRTRAFREQQQQGEEEEDGGKGLEEEGEQEKGRNRLERDGKWTSKKIFYQIFSAFSGNCLSNASAL